MGSLESAKDAAKLVQQIGNMELYEKLISVQTDARSILDENWKLKDEVRSLKEQLEGVRKSAAIDEDMEHVADGGFFVRKSERQAGKIIPYCPPCWTRDGTATPLNPGAGEGYYSCTIHKSHHETRAYRALCEQAARRSAYPDHENFGHDDWMAR